MVESKVKSSGDLSDAGLLIAAARGRTDALAEVFDRHGASVHGLACRLCGPSHAERVTKDVFVALWRSPEDFYSGAGSLGTALVAEAHRRAVDLIRGGTVPRRAIEATMSAEDVEYTVLLPWPDETGPSLLSEVPVAARKTITFAYFGGYTYSQVADLVRRPPETVRAEILAGLRHVRANTDPTDTAA